MQHNLVQLCVSAHSRIGWPPLVGSAGGWPRPALAAVGWRWLACSVLAGAGWRSPAWAGMGWLAFEAGEAGRRPGGVGGKPVAPRGVRTSQIYAKILDRPLGGQRRALWGAAGAMTPGARQRGLAEAAGGHSGSLRLLRAAQGTDSPPEHTDRGSHTTRTWAGKCRTQLDQPGCHRRCDPGLDH